MSNNDSGKYGQSENTNIVEIKCETGKQSHFWGSINYMKVQAYQMGMIHKKHRQVGNVNMQLPYAKGRSKSVLILFEAVP